MRELKKLYKLTCKQVHLAKHSHKLTMLTLYNAKLFIDNPYSHSLKYLLTPSSIFKIIVSNIKYFTCSTIGKQLLDIELKPIFIVCERQLYRLTLQLYS